jgi:Domain of unknown function (DUF222)/HNH endonuclease
MSDTHFDLASVGPDLISSVAAMSADERRAFLDGAFSRMRVAQGEIVAALGEVDRCQDYRDEGATSAESWIVERYGVSVASARGFVHVGQVAWDVPHLVGSLYAGDISFDKVRALAKVATPETDAEWRDQARECTVADLVEIARTRAALGAADKGAASESEHDRRYLRFNDRCRTMTAQLPAESYAEARTCLEARARKVSPDAEVGEDGETRWDQRLCDAFMEVIRSEVPGASGRATTASPYFVVVHVPMAALVEESGESTELAGELERDGLIRVETVQKVACDATIVIGVDDDVGHTMYEGRARREPTDAQRREVMRRDRHCRFPGCTNVTFTNVHHIVPWKPDGKTDLDNIALLCLHHHHLVHSGGWTMSGNANEELRFRGEKSRVMTSRPSPLWTAVTADPRSGLSGQKSATS